jgi:predicted double-glycine peptidase
VGQTVVIAGIDRENCEIRTEACKGREGKETQLRVCWRRGESKREHVIRRKKKEEGQNMKSS